jgi:hypothetical protein
VRTALVQLLRRRQGLRWEAPSGAEPRLRG